MLLSPPHTFMRNDKLNNWCLSVKEEFTASVNGIDLSARDEINKGVSTFVLGDEVCNSGSIC